jgi:endoglucanase
MQAKIFVTLLLIVACLHLVFPAKLKNYRPLNGLLFTTYIIDAIISPRLQAIAKDKYDLLSLQEVRTFDHGAIVRGNIDKKQITLVFTADEFADGGKIILATLQKHGVKGSFFFTGRFYRNTAFQSLIKQAKQQGHYLGPHSDQHLLYCDWTNRDSLLVTKKKFKEDIAANLVAIQKFGVNRSAIKYFIPPYEWYNDSIAVWTKQMGMQLVNYTPGTRSTSDYTTPDMKNYKASHEIYQSILDKEKTDPHGLNGFILLIHFGTDPKRTDKFYNHLDELITELTKKNYRFTTIEEL